MENAKKFFKEIAKTEEAKALFAAIEAPEGEEARIAAYVDIAKKLGVEFSADDVSAYFASSDNTASGELDDEELEQLVGGGDNAACADTFKQQENCWNNDGCDKVYNEYNDYFCKRFSVRPEKESVSQTALDKLRRECGHQAVLDRGFV